MSESQKTTDHNKIKEWAEKRNATPSCVRGTGIGNDPGILRLDFPGYSGDESLEPISWDEFFKKFDDQGLALVFQEKTDDGKLSNFNKIVNREAAA